MPKQGTRAEVNTFVKGLITEASPLNFPANASFEEVNFELNRDGTRNRRLGLDLEEDFTYLPAPILTADPNSRISSTYIWENVGDDGDTEFLVVQAGGQLRFFDLAVRPISQTPIATLAVDFLWEVAFSFTSVSGKLVVVGGGTKICIISWDGASFSLVYEKLMVRDQWGLEETDSAVELDPTVQPATLALTHHYNLQNQSWGIPRKDTTGTLHDPITMYQTAQTVYPSNSQVVWSGMVFQPVVGAAQPFERMYPGLIQERLGADNLAARGYYIIDLLDRGASRIAAVNANFAKYSQLDVVSLPAGSYPADYNTSGATVVTEFAGRVFYSGFNTETLEGDNRSPSLQDFVVFSQLVRNPTNISKCYQEGDPTSRDSNDVVDTDGGYMAIAGAKKIIGMKVLGTKLVVFASNGVWAISGGNNTGFGATNFKVDKLSAYGCISPKSITVQGTSLAYWGKDAIYGISPNQYNDLIVDDLTASTIQTLYNEIPMSAKIYSRGVYDLYEKKVKWFYRSGDFFTPDSVSKELIFDTVLKAFYQNEIAKVPGYTDEVSDIFYSSNPDVKLQHLTLHQDLSGVSFTFANYRDPSFRDWKTVNGEGTDAKAYLLTGTLTAGDSAVQKQSPYIVVHMKKTETGVDEEGELINPSSCLMRSQWNWSNSPLSRKFGALQEVYKYRIPLFSDSSFDNGLYTTISKNKLRGRGRSLALYFETSPDKDCHILGWSLTLNGNADA